MLEVGQVLENRYLIKKQIGAGGMGTVYIATDKRFGSTVAVKETLFTDPGLRRAFEREAQLLNSLRHPALPRVSDHFSEGNGAFIVMEFIAGEDLFEMVSRHGAFAVADVLRWADELLDALDYLHNQKMPVVHRDIKPQNLKLTPRGEVILLDFGLAKGSASELSQVSVVKSVFGYSRSYAPLEQIQGTGTDTCSDLYSLAATLYHLLTGKPPVDALSRATAVLNGGDDPLRPVHELNPKVSIAVSELFHQALALNAKRRPGSAIKMRIALNQAASGGFSANSTDSATLLVPPPSGEVFTQNTQLVNPADSLAAAGGVKTNLIDAPNLTNPQSFLNRTGTEQNTQTAISGSSDVPKSNSRRIIIGLAGIAAAILLLGSAGLAALYVNYSAGTTPVAPSAQPVGVGTVENNSEPSQPAANNQPPAASENAAENTDQNTGESAQKPVTSDKQIIFAEKPAPGDVTAEPKAPESVKENASGTKISVDVKKESKKIEENDDPADLKNLKKELDEALKNIEIVGKPFEGVPPEVRSNDPRNPVDQKKLKVYIQKQREKALQNAPPKPKTPSTPQKNYEDNSDN